MASLVGLGVMMSMSYAQNPNLTRSAAPVKQGQAQPADQNQQKHQHKTPDEWVSELDAVVGLSADQKTQAKTLADQTEAKMKALRAESITDKEALKQKRMQIHKEQKEGLDKILNADQKAKWQAHMREKMAQHGGGKGMQHRTPDQVVSDLDAAVGGLSDDQKAKIKTLAETKETKMKALREEMKANPDDAALQEKRKQIGKEYRDGLNSVLTADQKAKLKAQMEAHKQQQQQQRQSQPKQTAPVQNNTK